MDNFKIENGVLLSIHQNHFSDSKYSGAQVFYPKTAGSRELSLRLQENIKKITKNNFYKNTNKQSLA